MSATQSSLIAAIDRSLGGREILARAFQQPMPSNEEYWRVVEELAAWCLSNGLETKEKIEGYANQARRADFGHTYVKFLAAAGISYGTVMVLVVAASIALATCAPLIGLIAPAVIGIGAMWFFGVHALYAAVGAMSKDEQSRRPDGTIRSRFTRAAYAKTVKGAWGRELLAQTPGTVLGTAGVVALKLALGFVTALPAAFVLFAPFLMTLITVAAAALGFGLRDVFDTRTHAPLWGVGLDGDGRMHFDRAQAQSNRDRLGKPAVLRALSSTARMGSLLVSGFMPAYRAEYKKGMSWDKGIEFLAGGIPVGMAAMVGVSALTASSSTAVGALASAGRSAATGVLTAAVTNPLTSGRVQSSIKKKTSKNPPEVEQPGRTPPSVRTPIVSKKDRASTL